MMQQHQPGPRRPDIFNRVTAIGRTVENTELVDRVLAAKRKQSKAE